MTLMGTVENQAGLLACRWFLGLTEAGYVLISQRGRHANSGSRPAESAGDVWLTACSDCSLA